MKTTEQRIEFWTQQLAYHLDKHESAMACNSFDCATNAIDDAAKAAAILAALRSSPKGDV